MKPIEFKEQNVVFAKGQKEYNPLPALVKNDAYGTYALSNQWHDAKNELRDGKARIPIPYRGVSMSNDNLFDNTEEDEKYTR